MEFQQCLECHLTLKCHDMKKILFIIILLAIAIGTLFSQNEKKTYTLFQLADISDLRPQDKIKYSNILPITFYINDHKIVSKILNRSQEYANCDIKNIQNWVCEEAKWVFGVDNGEYFSNAMPEENIVVSNLEYSLNWCRWYLKEGVAHFATKCPLAIIKFITKN